MTYDTIIVHQAVTDQTVTAVGPNGEVRVATNSWKNVGAPLSSLREMPADISIRYISPKNPNEESWSSVQKRGGIKMTAREVRSEDTTFFTTPVRYPTCKSAAYGIEPNVQNGTWFVLAEKHQEGSYSHIVDFVHLKNTGVPHYGLVFPEFDTRDTLDRAIEDAFSSYDFLTEVAEGKETLKFLVDALKNIRHPLESFAKLQRRLRSEKKGEELRKALADSWLQYRYAIMPIYFSITDIIKTLKRADSVFVTSRAKSFVSADLPTLPTPRPSAYMYDEGMYEISISAVVKTRYDPASQWDVLLDMVKVNPFTTAWELIPFSFVVDWFINLSLVIEAQTRVLGDRSVERKACVSTHVRAYYNTYYNWRTPDLPYQKYVAPAGAPMAEDKAVSGYSGEGKVRTVVIDSYSRELADVYDVDLRWRPFLTEKRWLDAIALTSKNLTNSLRRLLT